MKELYNNLFVCFSLTLSSPLEVNPCVLLNKDINTICITEPSKVHEHCSRV